MIPDPAPPPVPAAAPPVALSSPSAKTGHRRLLSALVVSLVLGLLPAALAAQPQAPEAPPTATEPSPSAAPSPVPTLALELQGATLGGGNVHLAVTVGGTAAPVPIRFLVDGREVERMDLGAGSHEVTLEKVAPADGREAVVTAVIGDGAAAVRAEGHTTSIPGWLSIVPPLLAIGLALVFRDVLVSLFLGIFSGALILAGWHPISAFARSIDTYIAPTLAQPDHAKILIFSTLLGGMVGVISKSGGTRGVVERLTSFASTARRGQLATWIMGVAVFFDDYANTLIVGSTMRPITDRLRISREKLAYIVDSTAAPVASVFPISTWIGFEIGLIGTAFTDLGLHFNPYTTFIATIPFRFYPIFALVLGFAIASTGRDFGPMLRAERRARHTGALLADGDQALADYSRDALEPPEDVPHRAVNAVLPILMVVGATLVGLWVSGAAVVDRAAEPTTLDYVRDVFAESDSYNTLLWASLAGVVTGILLPVVQRILKLRAAMEGVVEGFKSMMLALVVLLLAWSISAVCGDLHTAEYLVGVTTGVVSPHWLPVLVFALSAVASFATGSSWGTMGVLMPLVIPISHGLSIGAGHPVDDPVYYTLMLGTISSVLAGSVWGDHCSPISDTTIMSSMSSACDHIAHVRTQIPYAVAIGVLGMMVGDIPTAYGLSPWVSLTVGFAVIVGGVMWLGKRVDDD